MKSIVNKDKIKMRRMRYVMDFLIDFELVYRVNRGKRTKKINDGHKILI